ALFPDLTYANNSGGDPSDIPNLTYEQLKNFHAEHYHPSNARFFTYGNLPLEQILDEIESKALSRFAKIDVDVSIPHQKRFTTPVLFEETYPLSKEEDEAKKAEALVAWATTKVSDSFEMLALKVLREVLLGNPGAPLHRALIASGLGEALADGTGFHDSYKEAVFAAGLKGISDQDADKVQQLVIDTLEGLATNGVDKEQVDAAIHQLEIEAREVSNAGFPYGFKVFFTLAGAYIYGGDPYKALQFDEDVAKLQKEREAGPFFENLIRRFLLDNKHRALIVLRPDKEKDEKALKIELDKLAKTEKALSDGDIAQIVAQAAALKQRQEQKQDVSVLPTLELTDVPMDFEDVPHEIETIEGATVGLFAQPTNGISYIDIRADFSGLQDRLKDYLPLFAFAVPKMGAAGDDYVKMSTRIAAYTGGIGAGVGVRSIAGEDGNFRSSFTISGKSLARNHAQFIGILQDLLTDVRFEPKRLKEVINQYKTSREAFVVQAGMMLATSLASSKLSAVALMGERLQGLTGLKFLKEIAKLEEGQLGAVIDDLNAVREYLFRNNALTVCVTSDEKNFPEIVGLLTDTFKAMPATSVAVQTPPTLKLEVKHEARTTAVPVVYNAKVIPTVSFTHPDAPSLFVLGNLMKSTYLHREIREKGGAYGSDSSLDTEKGLFTFWSYRDPNVVRTFGVFDSAVKEVIDNPIEADDLKEAILRSCSEIDPLESPDIKGRRRFFDDRAGYSIGLKAKFKQGLLEVTVEDLKRVAQTYLSGSTGAKAIVGSPEKIAEANKELGDEFEVSAI
ncbi:MAG: insulinase family protein, partial [Actinobacteria bacterium]|nr:insulinase family protein [Actinomycetota bacterium]